MNENVTKEARTFGMLCHLSSLSGFIIPFGNIVGPLIFWILKRDEYPFVDQEGKESLNFQISIFIYYMVSALLMLVLIGVALVFVVAVFNFIFVIIASVRANSGENYRYPLTIRFIK